MLDNPNAPKIMGALGVLATGGIVLLGASRGQEVLFAVPGIGLGLTLNVASIHWARLLEGSEIVQKIEQTHQVQTHIKADSPVGQDIV